jgi:hypothetical protein
MKYKKQKSKKIKESTKLLFLFLIFLRFKQKSDRNYRSKLLQWYLQHDTRHGG